MLKSITRNVKQRLNKPSGTRWTSTVSSAPQVSPKELSAWLAAQSTKTIQDDITIVDVRERHEIEKYGKIKGALNVPFKLSTDMFLAGLSDLNRQSKVRNSRKKKLI